MIQAIATIAGVTAGSGRRLITAGQPLSPAIFSRVQVTASSTNIGLDGVTWQTFGSDAPRRGGSTPRLLIEGQRTNGIRNPRLEGGADGVIGAGGTLPTNLINAPGTVTGLSVERVGIVTVAGVTCLRLRIFGTATASGNYFLFLEATNAIAAANAQTWTQSAFLRQHAAALGVPAVQLRPIARSSVGGQLSVYGSANLTITATLTRASFTFTIADATAAAIQPAVAFGVVSGVSYDAVFDIGWPQMEQGAFASSPILPSVGAPVAASRLPDSLTAPISALGIGGNGACTVLWNGFLSRAAGTAPQTIFQLDAGDSDRFVVRNEANGSNIAVARFLGGAAASAGAGAMVARTAFRVGMTVNGSGRAAASVNGAAAVAVTGGPTSGLTTLRIGQSAAPDTFMFGETRTVLVLRAALSDGDLAAWTGRPLD